MMPVRVPMIVLAVVSAVCGASLLSQAEDSTTPPMSPQEVESAIHELHPPLDQEQLSKLLFEVGRLQDPQEQTRLQGLLDDRTRELLTAQEATSEPPPPAALPADTQPGLSLDLTEEDLRVRIETLMLGPTATADDIRARDELVTAIAGVADPIKRDELLKRLEEREHQAEAPNELSIDPQR